MNPPIDPPGGEIEEAPLPSLVVIRDVEGFAALRRRFRPRKGVDHDHRRVRGAHVHARPPCTTIAMRQRGRTPRSSNSQRGRQRGEGARLWPRDSPHTQQGNAVHQAPGTTFPIAAEVPLLEPEPCIPNAVAWRKPATPSSTCLSTDPRLSSSAIPSPRRARPSDTGQKQYVPERGDIIRKTFGDKDPRSPPSRATRTKHLMWRLEHGGPRKSRPTT